MPQDISVKIYQYDELPTDKAKEKAREWYFEGADFGFEADWLKDEFVQALKEIGVYADKENMAWSAERGREWFFCLTHGAEIEDTKLFLKYCKSLNKSIDLRKKMWQDVIKEYGITISTQHYGGGYCKNHIVSTDETEDTLTECLNAKFEEFLKQIEATWDNFTSTEYIEENIRINEYTFLENGERFG